MTERKNSNCGGVEWGRFLAFDCKRSARDSELETPRMFIPSQSIHVSANSSRRIQRYRYIQRKQSFSYTDPQSRLKLRDLPSLLLLFRPRQQQNVVHVLFDPNSNQPTTILNPFHASSSESVVFAFIRCAVRFIVVSFIACFRPNIAAVWHHPQGCVPLRRVSW